MDSKNACSLNFPDATEWLIPVSRNQFYYLTTARWDSVAGDLPFTLHLPSMVYQYQYSRTMSSRWTIATLWLWTFYYFSSADPGSSTVRFSYLLDQWQLVLVVLWRSAEQQLKAGGELIHKLLHQTHHDCCCQQQIHKKVYFYHTGNEQVLWERSCLSHNTCSTPLKNPDLWETLLVISQLGQQ